MNIVLRAGAFHNGFDYFCPGCLSFFSVSGDYSFAAVSHCPACGEEGLITGCRKLAEFCREAGIDTVEYWEAFPPDEPLPYSRCAPTPRQIRKLFWAAAEDMRSGKLSSVDSLSRETGIEKEMVRNAVDLGTIKYEYLERGFVERAGPRVCPPRCPGLRGIPR
jgi:hypothetical protein